MFFFLNLFYCQQFFVTIINGKSIGGFDPYEKYYKRGWLKHLYLSYCYIQ